MEPTPTWSELAHLPIARIQDVMVARFIGRDEAAKLGFAPTMLTRIATAISEITRNVVQHAGVPGEMRVSAASLAGQQGLRIVVSDQGRGIDRPDRYLEETSSGNLGAGLPGTRRLMDKFAIQTAPEKGTTVSMEIWTASEVA